MNSYDDIPAVPPSGDEAPRSSGSIADVISLASCYVDVASVRDRVEQRWKHTILTADEAALFATAPEWASTPEEPNFFEFYPDKQREIYMAFFAKQDIQTPTGTQFPIQFAQVMADNDHFLNAKNPSRKNGKVLIVWLHRGEDLERTFHLAQTVKKILENAPSNLDLFSSSVPNAAFNLALQHFDQPPQSISYRKPQLVVKTNIETGNAAVQVCARQVIYYIDPVDKVIKPLALEISTQYATGYIVPHLDGKHNFPEPDWIPNIPRKEQENAIRAVNWLHAQLTLRVITEQNVWNYLNSLVQRMEGHQGLYNSTLPHQGLLSIRRGDAKNTLIVGPSEILRQQWKNASSFHGVRVLNTVAARYYAIKHFYDTLNSSHDLGCSLEDMAAVVKSGWIQGGWDVVGKDRCTGEESQTQSHPCSGCKQMILCRDLLVEGKVYYCGLCARAYREQNEDLLNDVARKWRTEAEVVLDRAAAHERFLAKNPKAIAAAARKEAKLAAKVAANAARSAARSAAKQAKAAEREGKRLAARMAKA